MRQALTLPGIDAGVWQVRTKFDAVGVALFDRHYSRQTKGGEIGPPGRKLVLVTPDEQAVWCTHWPDRKYVMDSLDAWRCSVFRREGGPLASELIRAAMNLTAQVWTERPPDGWVTWVDKTKVASKNPGYCFLQAGWWRDREWEHKRLIRFRGSVDFGRTPEEEES